MNEGAQARTTTKRGARKGGVTRSRASTPHELGSRRAWRSGFFFSPRGIGALVAWIVLKGLAAGSSQPESCFAPCSERLLCAPSRGWWSARRLRSVTARISASLIVTAAVLLGLATGGVWANVGSDYFSNVLGWMQSSSALALVGGLRGLGTRFTLARFFGASIATAKGKHINVDAVMRFVTPKLRVPLAVLTWMAASLVCITAVFAFVDHIAVEGFKAPAFVQCANGATENL